MLRYIVKIVIFPCYTEPEGWGLLHKAWIGYKRALNPRNGETFQDRLRWAVTIQNIQSDLGLQRTSFPTLGLNGDYIFTYNESKQMELEDLDNELFLKEWKKKRRAPIQEIVDASKLTEQEKEWMKEYASHSLMHQTDGNANRSVERVILPNHFDVRRSYHD